MPAILRKLPFYDRSSTVHVHGQPLRIFPYQIIIWVSLGPGRARDLDPLTSRFPAVLDTGFTDSFLIHQQQLRVFAGLQAEHLPRLTEGLRSYGRHIPLHDANLWIHPNKPGERDHFTGSAPFLLELHRGIGICRDADLYPRLPLLGARALRQAQLQVFLDYCQCQVSMRTPRRWWIFGWN
jgi:hypothetical protein